MKNGRVEWTDPSITDLERVTSLILPSDKQTLLLRLCCIPSDEGSLALAEWLANTKDAVEELAAERTGGRLLAPLLHNAAERSALPEGLRTYLGFAALREERRYREFSRVGKETLSILRDARIETAILGGAGIGEVLYDRPGIRHSGSIKLVLSEDDAEKTWKLLTQNGFQERATGLRGATALRQLVSPRGLPFWLGTNDAWFARHRAPVPQRLENRPCVAFGIDALIVSPLQNLLHVCAEACIAHSRETLLWARDASLLVPTLTSTEWAQFGPLVADSDLKIPLTTVIRYLASELQCPIPRATLARLGAIMREPGRLAGEFALKSVRDGGSGGFRKILKSIGSKGGMQFVVRWAILPSPEFVRATAGSHSGWPLPVIYFMRPIRYLARRVLNALRLSGRPGPA